MNGFDKTAVNTSTPYTTTVTVNSINNADQNVSLLTTKQSGQSMSPTSVSPVLASEIVV